MLLKTGSFNILHAIILAVVLFIFWLLLSGDPAPLLLVLGAASVMLVVYIAHRMDVVDHEGQSLHLTFWAPLYWLWLLGKSITANFDVARRIWQPIPEIGPTMIHLKATQKSTLGRVIYANSITLLPGTFTTDVKGPELEVHALTFAAAEDLKSGEMNERVSRMS
jgi:multicomponent Na+:H+ antiporter subunit E